MRYLSVLVLVEGPSDEQFFEPVLTRAVVNLVQQHVEPEVQVACEVDVVPGRAPRATAILERAEQGPFDIVVLHVDGSADPARERGKSFVPVERAWPVDAGIARLMAIMPIHEMEAWALCELDLVWELAGRQAAADEIFEGGLLDTPEKLADPKRTLGDILRQGRKRRRTTQDAGEYLPLLGERVSLTSLQALPSYRAFEKDFVQILTEMGWTR